MNGAFSRAFSRSVLCLSVVFLLVVSSPLLAQDGTWARHYGGVSTDRADCIAQTWDGGWILAGHTASYGDGTGIFFNLWLLKLDSFGRPEWQKVYPSAEESLAYSVVQTYDGGFLLTADSKVVGQTTLTALLMKTDASGNLTWRRDYSGAGTVALRSAREASDGGFVAAGYVFDSGSGHYAPWILKVDVSGDTQWQSSFPRSLDGFGSGVLLAGDGGYLLGASGNFSGSGRDFWLIKVDSTGGPLWQKSYGGAGNETGPVLRRTPDLGFLLAGTTDSFGSGGQDGWVLRLDHSGNVLWQWGIGTPALELIKDVQPVSEGGCILAGYWETPGRGVYSGWLIRLGAGGDLLWQKSLGGSEQSVLNTVAPNADGSFTAAGDTVAWGPGGDAWVVRIDSAGNMDPSCAPITPGAGLLVSTAVAPVDLTVPAAVPTLTEKSLPVTPQNTATSFDIICAAPCAVRCESSVPASTMAGLPTRFGASAEPLNCDGPATVQWSFGDGIVSTELLPLHTYSTAGSFTWTLTATSGAATCSKTGTITVATAQPALGTTWARHYGTGATERDPGGIRRTADGGFLLGCSFYPEGSSNTDLWLLKTDAYGAVLSQSALSGTAWDEAYDLQPTPDGGALLAGTTKSSGAGDYDSWLLKLDASGSCVWQKTFGVTEYDRFRSMALTADGGTVAAGAYTVPGTKNVDIRVVKLDASGTIQWQKSYGDFANDTGASVIQASDGTYLVAGETRSFGAGETDIWVFRLDASGGVLWQYAYGGPGIDSAISVREVSPGSFVVAGTTRPDGYKPFDGLVLALDSSGSLLWANRVGGVGSDQIFAIEAVPSGGIIAAGYTDIYASGSGLGWLARMDASGHLRWQRSIGELGFDTLQGVVPTPDGGFTAAGNTIEHGVDVWALHLDGNGNMDAPCPLLGVPAVVSADWPAVRTPTTAIASTATGVAADSSLVQSPYGAAEELLCAPVCDLTCDALVPASATPGTPVLFEAVAGAIGCLGSPQYAWTFGDGTTSIEQTPSHTFAAAGSYPWTLAVTAGASTCQRQGTLTIGSSSNFFVSPTGTGSACTKAEPCGLDAALGLTHDGDTLYLAGGRYAGTGAEIMRIGRSITVSGSWPVTGVSSECRGDTPWFDGEGVRRCIVVEPGTTVTLNCLSVQAGFSPTDGGGIYAQGASLTLSNVSVVNSYVLSETVDTHGGGLYAEGGSLLIENGWFWGNSAKTACESGCSSYGGAIATKSMTSTTIRSTLIKRNDAWRGGGLYMGSTAAGAPFLLDGCEFIENGQSKSPHPHAGGYGGGAEIASNSATLEDNLFSSNLGGNEGGGLRITNGSVEVQRNRFLGNFSYVAGGAMISTSGKVFAENNIFAENETGYAEDNAGGLYISAPSATLSHNTFARNGTESAAPSLCLLSPSVLMNNSLIAGAAAGIYLNAGTVLTADHTLWGTGEWAVGTHWSGPGTATSTDEVEGDPAFVSPSTSDYHIRASSAAVDAGGDAGVAVDIDGEPRPMRSNFDIGADEVPPCHIVASATVAAQGNVGAPVPFAGVADTATCLGTPTFTWDFGDGATSPEQNPTHTYAQVGSFSWRFTVTAEGETSFASGTIAISAPLAPGDCNGDGTVSIGEVQKAINMFLGIEPPACGVDCSGDATVSIGEVQKVINGFLGLSSSC